MAKPARKKTSLTGPQKAAALIIALGPKQSSQVLKLLSEDQMEEVVVNIFKVDKLDLDTRATVFKEAHEIATATEYVSSGGVDYARELLQATLGVQRTQELLYKLSGNRDRPFEFVRDVDPSQLMSFLQGEHPQTVALVLCHLPPTLAASILSAIEPDFQAEVASRVASMNRTSPDVIDAVEKSLKRKLSSVTSSDYSSVGGLDFLVRMLKNVDRSTEKSILTTLDSTLADEVKKSMFVFEDIVNLDDRSIQRILRDVNTNELGLALKGTSEDVRRRILANMSTRAAQTLREDMEAAGPVRLKAVEEAQTNIVRIIRKLDEAEEIVVSRGSSKEEMVL